jgi:hypothetical protein
MHTYIKSKDENLWTVGCYQHMVIKGGPSVADMTALQWRAIKDFAREEDAAEYTSYLNGGRRP